MTTPPTIKKQTARATALEREARQRTMRMAALAIVAVFIVGGAIFYIAGETIRGQQDQVRPEANPAEQVIPDEGAGHLEVGVPTTYQHYPPSSGAHYGTTAPVGYLPEAWPEGYWVHNLEHGHVVLLYQCANNDCADLQSKIQNIVNKVPLRGCSKPRLLAMPYSQGMTGLIIMVAWGRQLDLSEFDEEAIVNFYKRYENQGPEKVGCPE
ncbi:MAG TPA: DUF3105 domain-containing protein [Anaerolineales bacterium]|nr:DUF3105 domain-containing protein [Anaerolineales bacterium]